MSQFKPARSETTEVKYLAKRCERLARAALQTDHKYDRIFWFRRAEDYSAEAFALAQKVAARSVP
jgi:hypothetical protein